MSSEYLLPCPCGQSLLVSKSQAGQSIECSCGQTVAVPTLRGFAQLQTADTTTNSPRSSRRYTDRSPQAWNPVRGLISALSLGLLALCLYNVSYFGYWYNQLDLRFTVADEIKAGEEMIDSMPVGDTWNFYRNLQDSALGNRRLPPFMEAQLNAKYYIEQMTKYGLIAAGLGAIALTAILWPKKK
jgi:hypothetical protein